MTRFLGRYEVMPDYPSFKVIRTGEPSGVATIICRCNDQQHAQMVCRALNAYNESSPKIGEAKP